ncbi:MAG: ATP-dependent DNA helicase RecG [Bacteroidia bacterium]|nr:ATP-dependent DNA helicase RecG [Bacteroidia bacterium]
MADFLKQEIKFLPGVGPKRAELLNRELAVSTFEDLLYYFPYRYVDRSKFTTVRELNAEMQYVQLKGKIVNIETVGERQGKRLIAYFSDDTGVIELVFFQGIKWIKESLKLENTEYIVFGKPSIFNNKINIIHPEIEEAAKQEKKIGSPLQPLYSTTERLKNSFLNSKAVYKLITTLVQSIKTPIAETLPESLIKEYRLLPVHDALVNIHFPGNWDLLQKAQYRLKFEELFYSQLNILKLKKRRITVSNGYVFSKVGDYFNNFYKNNLPFELTNAQKNVIREIRKDLGSGKQMNRLLQGDVGSGKTLVAMMCMLIALDNGYQSCLMVPTEILATQHYNTFVKFLQGLDIHVELLTGSTKKRDRNRIHELLQNGGLHILIGTHALIEDTVQFKNLGFAVIDEQHRFGVAQRAKLWSKSDTAPHVLVMTATPIPRTLQMTAYGDLDVSVINELPPGRKPIETKHYTDALRLKVFGEIRNEIKKGRQVYVVYPLIKESEKMDYKYLEDGVESFLRAFPPPGYVISVVHGQQKNKNKDFSMELFVSGKAHILIATTVIEVGVDVPNATMMVIESAERFGLSQLHQLRGRVGRGAEKSVCILMTKDELGNDTKKRMRTLCETNDGFIIAEVDLELRGPGDIEGTQQSGMPCDLKIANLARDGQLIQYVRGIADKLLDDDPMLEKPENILLKKKLHGMKKDMTNWGDIS